MTGGTLGAPITLLDMWNADKAGSLRLLAPTAAALDLSLTRAIRPTEKVALKINLIITGFSVAGNITLTGKDKDGGAQSEAIAVAGNGTLVSALWYSSIDAGGIDCTGTYTVEITQSQWGVIWKLGTNTFAFDARLYVGDNSTTTFLTDTNKLIILNKGWWAAGAWMLVRTAATVTFGTVVDATLKHTANGCCFLSLEDTTPSGFLTSQYAGAGIVNLYSCSFYSLISFGIEIWAGTNVWNCLLVGSTTLSINANTDVFNLQSQLLKGSSPMYALQLFSATGNTFNGLNIFGSDKGLRIGDISITLRNCSISDFNSYGCAIVNSAQSNYLIDCTMSTWTFQFYNSPTAQVYRQYSFNVNLKDKNGAAISGATVTLKDKNGTQIFSVTTDANGNIAVQTVSRDCYDGTHGDTPYSPHTLTISKAGYQTYASILTLTAAINLFIKLAKTGSVLLSLGQPVLNLKASDPENLNVLVL
jgi:hypothetical protein